MGYDGWGIGSMSGGLESAQVLGQLLSWMFRPCKSWNISRKRGPHDMVPSAAVPGLSPCPFDVVGAV